MQRTTIIPPSIIIENRYRYDARMDERDAFWLDEYSDGNIYNYLSASDMGAYHTLVADHLHRPELH